MCLSKSRFKNEDGRSFLEGQGYRVHHPYAYEMKATERDLIQQNWNVVQHELVPQLGADLGGLTPLLDRVIHGLEWVPIEEFTHLRFVDLCRPPRDRAWRANAFAGKAVLGPTTQWRWLPTSSRGYPGVNDVKRDTTRSGVERRGTNIASRGAD